MGYRILVVLFFIVLIILWLVFINIISKKKNKPLLFEKLFVNLEM